MKNLIITTIMAVVLSATLVYAQTPAKPIEVGNKVCPVSGEKIPAAGEQDEMGGAVQYEYNGKVYNLCCSMCVKDFKKNPEKYSKIAEEEVAKEKSK